MKPNIFVPFFLFPVFAFSQASQDLYLDEDGIKIEKYNPGKSYDDNYSLNNSIYTIGRKLTYSYYYENKKGDKFLIKKGKEIPQPQGYNIYDWDFVELSKKDPQTVQFITLTTTSGDPFHGAVPDYNQTAIEYQYVTNNGELWNSETTGAIENPMNVWIHPPRNLFFEILELNPFPYIKSPYTVGTKWDWKLQIGENWGDSRWLKWTGEIENHYQYEIIGQKMIPTKLGDLDCYLVQGKAKSRIGETQLLSYFSPEFGFVKLEYKNIDGTKTVLELEKAE
ncbi:hypothetical protein SAMN05443633_104296 [Chryseobacterium arachidis]|uniref:Uncharacterized protein n=1 Tax=Chryseobacterium arachidis TaxID=1416778 RepID=A0A1M5BU38_9FLAO|nr:hypothetical protein [Chryseobacterium arachidis]SHF46049.1 hypothetical protein SAMN05443633_104296 [Chryseobacterium arachidis]